MDIKKILVPTDFSACSTHAAAEAIELASKLGAKVTLLHAYGLPIYVSPEGGQFLPNPQTLFEVSESARDELLRLKQRVVRPDVEVDCLTEQSPPADAILRIAEQGHYDLVVMGTHGRTGIKHLLVGSVAEKVVRTCATPVLTVHEHQEAAPAT